MGLPFTKSRSRKRDQIIAIDLGGRSSKAVYLQSKGDRFTLANYVILDAASHEKSISPDILAEHLKEIGRALDARGKHVTVALSVNETVFKQAEVPVMAPGDLRQMLKYNTKNYLQQDLADHVFDCHYLISKQPVQPTEGARPGGSAQQKQKALIGGAKRQTIEDVSSAIRAAGFIPDQILPSIIGPVNAFELAEPESFAHDVVAIVEVGFKSSTIAILNSGELMLHRVVTIGGDQFTQGLADQLNTSYAEAENIKLGLNKLLFG